MCVCKDMINLAAFINGYKLKVCTWLTLSLSPFFVCQHNYKAFIIFGMVLYSIYYIWYGMVAVLICRLRSSIYNPFKTFSVIINEGRAKLIWSKPRVVEPAFYVNNQTYVQEGK